MQRRICLVAALAAVLSFGAHAFAQQPKSSPPAKSSAQKQKSSGDFRRVSLGGDPNFTIEVPTSKIARQHDLDTAAKPNGELLYFLFGDSADGYLSCHLVASEYVKNMTPASSQQAFIEQGRSMCLGPIEREHGGKPSVGEVNSFKHRGDPALACAVSYMSKRKDPLGGPGTIDAVFYVAAPRKLYVLNCILSDRSQDDAQDAWGFLWGPVVRHMQDSLRIPR
jgi:hypothetical protein